MKWNQDELATYRAVGDWEKLWEATVPLVKLQYGRMVRSGVVPEPAYKGDDEWLQEMMLLAGEAMRKWDPEKGAYSTYIISCVSLAVRDSMDREARRGVTARHREPVVVLSTEDQRPGVQPDDEADDDGTFNAVLAYGGTVERDRRPGSDEAPEGLGDPVDEVERLQSVAHVMIVLACLPPEEREALIASQTQLKVDYAAEAAVHRNTIGARLARAKRNFVRLFGSGLD